MKRPTAIFLSAGLLFAAGCLGRAPISKPPAGRSPVPVVEATIAGLHRAMAEGRLTARELVESYLERVEAYDQTTGLNAIVAVNPAALADADALDAELARTKKPRPLHGIPVIIKDNYDVAGLPTTAGSLALRDSLPPDDAAQVRRLREAGAVILAKSNMAEWAFSPYFTESSVAGVTRNPYDLERVPAGSSGGTAAAVAASFGAAGLGTDTGNSIRGPSSHCALVGIRPTMGLASRDGIVPLYLRNDVGGPMARTVEDAVRILQAIAGPDPADPVTESGRGRIPRDYAAFLDRNGLRGARLGVFRTFVDDPRGDPAIKALVEKAIADMKAEGAVIVDPFVIPDFEALTKGLWCDMFKGDVEAYLAALGPRAPFRTLADIVASGKYVAANERRLRQALEADGAPTPACLDLYHDPRNIKLRDAVRRAMDEAKIDAIVYPTWSHPPRKIGDMRSPAGDNSQLIPPHTGMPGFSVPMGYAEGRWPAGLQIVGRVFDEPGLIRIAYAYEQATRHRRAPAAFPELGRAGQPAVSAAEAIPSPFIAETQRSPVEESFRAVRAVSAKVAWASGSRGAVCRTTDGGATWELLAPPRAAGLDFRMLAAFDADRAIAANAGSPGFIFKTSDGGKTWKTVLRDERPGFFLDALVFWDERRGLAVGDPIDGRLLGLATEDGGESWTPLPDGALPPPAAGEAFFAASNSSLATCGRTQVWLGSGGGPVARVFASDDEGRTFRIAEAPVTAGKSTRGIFGLAFRSPREGLAVGGDYREMEFRDGIGAATHDGGRTWLPLGPPGLSGFREGVAFVPNRTWVLAIGPGGADESLDNGRSWRPFALDGCHAVAFAPDGTAGWAAGNKGRIVRLMIR
jgi:amidase